MISLGRHGRIRVLRPCLLAASCLTAAAVCPGAPPLRCGSQCLYVAAKALEKAPPSFAALEELIGSPTASGYSLEMLKTGAERLELHTLAVATTFENLRWREGQFVCLAHLDGDHFVLFSDVNDSHATIIDPPTSYRLPLSTLNTRWQGAALLISTAPLESEAAITERIAAYRVAVRILVVFAGILVVGCAVYVVRRRSSGR